MVATTDRPTVVNLSLETAIPKARNGEGYCVNYCVGAEKGGIR